GRKNTVWVREAPTHGSVISFSALFTDQTSFDAFLTMYQATETLLFQTDTGQQYYVVPPLEPEVPLHLTGSRLAGKPVRTPQLDFTESDRPTAPPAPLADGLIDG